MRTLKTDLAIYNTLNIQTRILFIVYICFLILKIVTFLLGILIFYSSTNYFEKNVFQVDIFFFDYRKLKPVGEDQEEG